ncbi:hypothetical protein Ga0466249_004945 [Sporomusaceae bacterium BoRhaA]|uniref:hemagglutinin repeat-containing protein n=1 Tax=Pelorhabdus rhamnosifermentans TaxID=2772457 RepID=UPI0028A6A87F|nr:hemagglutinin repeat-containing protein [Pelorhabdus rhamnosifermentans]MBU2703795.1 hypothetical protein [Pelorhabdus rhamnosifermentans]
MQDDRLKALYDYKAVEDLKDVGKNMDIKPSISVSLGSTKITSEQTNHTETVNLSNINAGGDVNIIATAGDVNLKGTKINAADVTLDAKNNLNIDAAQNKEQTTSTTSSSSSSVGGNIGTGYFVNSSKGSGHENGNAITNEGSVINASGTVSLVSGKDTNITGSQVNGGKVIANIGGNLNIASLQDIDNYNAKNQNSGIGISSGHNNGITGSAGKGKTDSNYGSVTEQAGIHAGKDGFDITVGKNTDLKGAVIASTATPDKNKISTDTLTHSDIQNKADYSASSTGVDLKNGIITSTPSMPVNGKADSTTKSAISPGKIEIRSNPNQDISGLSRNTNDSLNALGKIFDKKTVQERQELVNLFGQEANQIIGDLAESMRKNAKTPEEKAKWAEGGEYKALLHAVSSGIVSGLAGNGFASGAAGDGLSQLAQKQLANIKDPNLRLIASSIVGAAAAKVVGGNAQAGASAAFNGVKHNDYVHHPTYEGAYIFVKGEGFYKIINGVDTYMQDDVPPVGAVVWQQDPDNKENGSEYVKGDGINSADTYLKWKPGISGRIALNEDTGDVITINGEAVIHPSDLKMQQQAKEDVTGLAGGVKRDLKMVNDAAREIGVDRDAFGDYIHEIKDDLGMAANQNFTYQELLEYARQLKKMIE